LLACAAYVDLNPIRAAMAETLEQSDFTSVQRRIQSLTGPALNQTGFRCSDKGFLPMTLLDYLELLDWTARQLAPGKQGSTPQSAPPILERLNVTPKAWIALAADFGKLFSNIAGRPEAIDETRSRVHQHRFHMRSHARELLTPA
jgi:hypothetical protein